MTSQVEGQLLRELGAALIKVGQYYHQQANLYDGQNDPTLTPGAAPTLAAPYTAPPAPPAQVAPAFPAPIAPPPAPVAPASPAAPAADSGKRKRRSKAEIELDEKAIAAGYLNHADMVAKSGGGVAAGPAGPAAMQPLGAPGSVAPGAAPVPPMPGVQFQPPVPPAPPAGPVGPTPDDMIAEITKMIVCVEAIWPGHGEGQAGLLLGKFGFPNVAAVPAEARKTVIDWIKHFVQEFPQNKLPQGVGTPGFIN